MSFSSLPQSPPCGQAFFDVETTGLEPWAGDRICEVGIVVAQGDEILETYTALVNPLRPLSAGAAAVNGLSDELLRHQPTFAQIADAVLQRLEGRVVVCHNARFDLSFLQSELARLGRTWQPQAVIDTLELARRYFHFASNNLSAVATALGIAVPETHRALSDALTTYRVFRRFQTLLNAEEQGGDAGSLPALQRWDSTATVPYEIPPLLRQALERQAELEILYQDGAGKLTRRRIRPLQLLPAAGTVYVVAYCHLRGEERHFRLDRMKILPLQGGTDV